MRIIYPIIFVASVYVWKAFKRHFGMQKSQHKKLIFVILGVVLILLIEQPEIDKITQISAEDLIYTIGINTILFSGFLLQEYLDNGFESLKRDLSDINVQKQVIYAPILEEMAFRLTMDGVLLQAVYFSLAHSHMYYRQWRKEKSHKECLLITLFTLSYTFIFGLYCGTIYQKTNSLVCAILLHSMCNYFQVPKFKTIFENGRLQGSLISLVYVIGVIFFFNFL